MREPHLISIAMVFSLWIGAGSALQRGLWNPDEPRVGQIAREMVSSGDWVVPQLNGTPFVEKPPLCFWLVSVLLTIGLPLEMACRLPSLLASACTTGLLTRIGTRALSNW